jgi:hypothetical protein
LLGSNPRSGTVTKTHLCALAAGRSGRAQLRSPAAELVYKSHSGDSKPKPDEGRERRGEEREEGEEGGATNYTTVRHDRSVFFRWIHSLRRAGTEERERDKAREEGGRDRDLVVHQVFLVGGELLDHEEDSGHKQGDDNEQRRDEPEEGWGVVEAFLFVRGGGARGAFEPYGR